MEDVKNTNVYFAELAANDPTLILQTPSSERGDAYVMFGIDDDHFQYMLDCYINSATHGAICNAMAIRIYGMGLDRDDVVNPNELRKFIKDRYIFGNAAWQKVNGKLLHVPVNYLRKEPAQDDGRVLMFQYSTGWDNGNDAERIQIPNGLYSNANRVIYWSKTYAPNTFYYGLPSFEHGLAYAELEIENSRHLLTTVQRSFSVTKVINYNNGDPGEEKRKEIKKKTEASFSGTNGSPFVVAFNDNADNRVTVDDITVDNAAEKYQYVSTEAERKLIVAHGITSPLLLGIRDTGGGLGSNTDEMEAANELLMRYQIEPLQREIEESIYIATGERVKFINDDDTLTTELSSQENALNDFIGMGEDAPEGFDLYSSEEVDYETDEEICAEIEKHFAEYEPTMLERVNNLVEMVSTGKASPRTKSSQDTADYAIRYRYTRGGKANELNDKGSRNKDRSFCVAMENADKLYRKEDIQAMRNKPVNPGFGLRGSRTYDIWLYKGGARCRHKWIREVYVKSNISDRSRVQLNERISVAQARRNGAKIETNNPKVAIVPDNMKNKGYKTRSTMPADAKAQNTGI